MPTPTAADARRGTANDRIKVLLVDDHEVVLEALAATLRRREDMEILAAARSVRELEEAPISAPDVAVVDYQLPDGTGADACRQIKARWPQARIVMLSGQDDEEAVLGSVRAGADGYVTKSQPLATVVAAIHAAMARQPAIDPDVIGRIARQMRSDSAAPRRPALREPLTARELTVLRELSRGYSTRVIAGRLHIAEGTVRRHVEGIRGKFGVSSKLEAVSEALRQKIIDLPPPGS